MKEEIIRSIVGSVYWVFIVWIIGSILGLPKMAEDLKAIRKLLEGKESASIGKHTV
jgi:hypothetical protein